MTVTYRITIVGLLLAFIVPTLSPAQEKAPSPPTSSLFEIHVTSDQMEIVVFDGAEKRSIREKANALRFAPDTVSFGQLFVTRDSLFLGTIKVALADVSDAEIIRNSPREKIVRFVGRPAATTGSARLRGNRIAESDTITIAAGQFVRGNVVTVTGHAHVAGEVNRNVIALFGDITLLPGAVVRGHLITFSGIVTVDRSSALYGEVVASDVSRTGRNRYVRNLGDYLGVREAFIYNRVDGALPMVGFSFGSPDSSLPTVSLLGGYAFAAEGTRLHLKIGQRIDTGTGLRFDLEAYRFARTNDRHLFGLTENSLAALLAREDFFDYVEARGFAVQLSAQPSTVLNMGIGYRIEATRWLDADPDLWSLFGGNKRFPANFRAFDDSSRAVAKSVTDTADIAELSLRFSLGQQIEQEILAHTRSRLAGEFIWSSSTTGASMDYRWFRLHGEHVQTAGASFLALARIELMTGSGDLPVQRLAYLGGTNTLWGYRQKEFVGLRSWHVNLEPRLRIPRTPCSVSFLYDAGQITSTDLFSGDEIRQSVGGAIYLFQEKGIVSISQRLDSDPSRKIQLYVRLGLTLP